MATEVEGSAPSLQSIVEKHPRDRASVLQILREVQHVYRYIPQEMVPDVSRHVRMTPLEVHAVLTFYKELRTTPPGEVMIRVCDGPACHAKGMDHIIRAMEHFLGISLWETTKDGQFSLEMYPCYGTCDHAPFLTVNGVPYSRVTPDQVSTILREWGWEARR